MCFFSLCIYLCILLNFVMHWVLTHSSTYGGRRSVVGLAGAVLLRYRAQGEEAEAHDQEQGVGRRVVCQETGETSSSSSTALLCSALCYPLIICLLLNYSKILPQMDLYGNHIWYAPRLCSLDVICHFQFSCLIVLVYGWVASAIS